MFRHKNHTADETKKPEEAPVVAEQTMPEKPLLTKAKDTSPAALRELLEKNLKWSQIIYEQNRRINHKLFWQAFAGWIRVFIIVVPLILAVIYLPPFINQAWSQYQALLGQTNMLPKDFSPTSLEKFLKLLPIDSAKQEQVKTILK